MPADLSDTDIESEGTSSQNLGSPTHMSYAIHLFKLAKINSEIKYVANSVNPDAPNYSYPAIISINAWQEEVLSRSTNGRQTFRQRETPMITAGRFFS